MVHAVLVGVMAWLAFDFLDGTPTFTTSMSYSVMSKLLPQRTYGLLCGAAAIIGLMGFCSPLWKVRIASSAVLAVAHTAFALLFFAGNPHAPAAAFCLGYAVLGFSLAYSHTHLANRAERHMEPSDPSRQLAR
jgi:hypothetical protein